MRLRQIEVFHAVYVNGSVSGAARVLHVSQPAVSKVLHHTQDQLGFRLFHLVRGRLVPTQEAHALFREVSDVFGRISSLQQAIRNIKSAGGGHLRIAVVPSLGLAVGPLAISRFRTKFPEVTFDVQTLHHGDLFRALYERECDIAFAYDPPAHPRMKRVTLTTGQPMLLLPEAAAAELPDPVPLKRLEDEELIGLGASSGPIGALLAAELRNQDIEIQEVVSAQTFYIAAAIARFGSGMTIVDEFTARASATGGMVFRSIEPRMEFAVECVFLEDLPPSSLARKFIEMFRKALIEQQATSTP